MQLRYMRLVSALFIAMPALTWAAGTIVVTPGTESVLAGSSRQYTATVTGLPSMGVTWSVNGMPNGSPAVGTISNAGVFTAPMMAMQVTITATSTADITVAGNAIANIKLAGPSLTSVSPNSIPKGTFAITLNGAGFVNGALAYLNGQPLSTTYISGTQLKAVGLASIVGNNYIGAGNPVARLTPRASAISSRLNPPKQREWRRRAKQWRSVVRSVC